MLFYVRRFIRRKGVGPLRPLYRMMCRWRIKHLISNGEFNPEPTEPCLTTDYERPLDGESIPKVFHYTWKSEDLPSFYRECKETIEQQHPSPPWTHRLWTDDEIDEFVSARFAERKEQFYAMPQVIMRVDVFRYMLLYEEGGVYSDLDVIMYRPIDELIADCRLLLPLQNDRDGMHNQLCQHFLASVPRHPFWRDLIDHILDRPLDELAAYSDPLRTTGPIAVTRFWQSRRHDYKAKLPKRVYICPPSEYLQLDDPMPESTYCIHACTGTWRSVPRVSN